MCININKLIKLINQIYQHRAHLKGLLTKKYISRCENLLNSFNRGQISFERGQLPFGENRLQGHSQLWC